MLKECFDNVRKSVPLVHNITNYVTVNDVANIILGMRRQAQSCPMNQMMLRTLPPYAAA